jgi:ParB-like chromosome segregation protein Spo0J
MTSARLLVQRRRALFDRLVASAAGDEDRIIKPAFLRLRADIQTAIAVIEAVLADPHTLEGAIMSEMTLTTIPIARVQTDGRLRGLNEKQVTRLVESIREIGLLNPITVWAMPGAEGNMVEPDYGIVAGAHRLEACRRLDHTEIAANVVDLPDLKRQLAEVDENLAGPTLTKAERALFTKRRKELYEQLHPETRPGGDRRSTSSRKHCDKVERFTADTAARTGRSERSIQLDATRGEAIDEDVLKAVKGTDFDLGNTLDALAKLPVEQQQAVAAHVRNGDLVSAKAVISPPKVSPPADQAGDGTPANDAKNIHKQIDALMVAWNKACPEARNGFLEQIDRPPFDNICMGQTGQTIADLTMNPGDVRPPSPAKPRQGVADDGAVHHQPDE